MGLKTTSIQVPANKSDFYLHVTSEYPPADLLNCPNHERILKTRGSGCIWTFSGVMGLLEAFPAVTGKAAGVHPGQVQLRTPTEGHFRVPGKARFFFQTVKGNFREKPGIITVIVTLAQLFSSH